MKTKRKQKDRGENHVDAKGEIVLYVNPGVILTNDRVAESLGRQIIRDFLVNGGKFRRYVLTASVVQSFAR